MRLQTLGGLGIAGRRFGRPKPLLLLAYLAVEGGQDRRHLAELFWPDARDHMKSLTVALAQIRQGAPGALESDRQRVLARLECDAVDVLERLDRGDHAAALAAYGGPFADGVFVPNLGSELEEWILGTREFIAAKVQRARLDLAEADAARERFQAAARQAERAYAHTEAIPDPNDLERLHTVLLAGGSPRAREVRREADELGLDLARTGEMARKRLRERLAAARRQAPPALPTRGTSFVGRDPELAEIATLLARPDVRLLTLIGPCGVGKSRLAHQVASELHASGSFAGGIHAVSLESLRPGDAIAAHLLDALALEGSDAAEPLDSLIAGIGEREMLLVCDAAEHLIDEVHVFSALLASCPGLCLLVTSRQRLDLELERTFPLSGMPYPQDGAVDPDEAMRFDAVRLFTRRARRARPDFELSASDVPHVVTICRLVDGLPLALELAAVGVRVMPPDELALEIERDLDTLATSLRDVPERHRTMRGAFEHSWRLLSPRERSVMRRLAIFRGGFDRHAAGAVATATIPTLVALVDKSMLRVDRRGRYGFHPLLHHYARQKLAAHAAEESDAAARHVRFYLDHVRQSAALLRAGRQKEALDRIEVERENIRAALFATPPGRAIDSAVDTLTTYFETRSRFREGAALFRSVREHGPPTQLGDGLSSGPTTIAEARLRRYLGEYGEALRLARQGLGWARAEGDEAGVRRALQVIGVTSVHLGHYAQARRAFEEGLALAEVLDDRGEHGVAHANLGLALQLSGDPGAALERLRAALDAFRSTGDTLRQARLLNNLGLLHFELDDVERAGESWEEGVALARADGNERDLLSLTSNLGMLHARTGDRAAARRYNDHALQVARGIGDASAEASALAREGALDLVEGDVARAEERLRHALELALRVGETPRVLEFLKLLAEVRVAQGEAAEATALFSLVRHHAASTRALREQASGWLPTVTETLPGVVAEAAIERGCVASAEEMARSLVRGALGRTA
jgi:predicted ATPase